jgi:hypothetical protein
MNVFWFVSHYLSLCTFSFDHCIACPSSIYGFWLLLLVSSNLLKCYWWFDVCFVTMNLLTMFRSCAMVRPPARSPANVTLSVPIYYSCCKHNMSLLNNIFLIYLIDDEPAKTEIVLKVTLNTITVPLPLMMTRWTTSYLWYSAIILIYYNKHKAISLI